MDNSDETTFERSSKVERAVKAALASYDVRLDQRGKAFLMLQDEDNPQARPLYGKAVAKLLRKEAYTRGDLLKRDEVSEILEHLYAHAAVGEESVEVFLRVGPSAGEGIEIDLGTPDNARVRLQSGQASVIERDSNTLFTRSDTLLPLPKPSDSGEWQKIQPFLNMSSEHQLLLIGWLTYSLSHYKGGQAAFPILVIKGEHGTGKSTLCRHVVRGLVDNNASDIQLFPREPREMAISSTNQHVIIYDNVSSLSKAWSQALCVASTGGSLSSRRLYTDSEESLLPIHTPVVLNGITGFITEADLASRTVTILLEKLSQTDRKSEGDLSAQFEQGKPAIFRGLLDLAAGALQHRDQVHPQYKSRLTEFIRWLAAMEKVMSFQEGYLQDIYHRNVVDAKLETIQENPLAMAVIRFAKNQRREVWSGTPNALLMELEKLVGQKIASQVRQWPQNPIAMSKRLKPLVGTLEEQGVYLDFQRRTDRMITVQFTGPERE